MRGLKSKRFPGRSTRIWILLPIVPSTPRQALIHSPSHLYARVNCSCYLTDNSNLVKKTFDVIFG